MEWIVGCVLLLFLSSDSMLRDGAKYCYALMLTRMLQT